ncbi:MAG: DUF3515 family protein [Propionibacteriales bacterium]|nr:DUF3515 family protein [Propionibacteriales bacterium]
MAGVVTSALLAVVGLAGCAGSNVHVDGFAVSSADRAACRQLLTTLPAKVDDQSRRTVTGSTYAAAWGDPAIVLRCGVSPPKGSAGDPCITRNGIGWTVPPAQADELGRDLVMTLAFRSPVIQVRVPATYRPNGPSAVMADLDRAVRTHTTAHGKCS